MAEPDPQFPGLSLPSFSFFADSPSNSPLSYDQLQMRRKLAAVIAAQKQPYPKTIGEGIAAIGDAIGSNRTLAALDAQERAYESALIEAGRSAPIPGLDAPPSRRADVGEDNAPPGAPALAQVAANIPPRRLPEAALPVGGAPDTAAPDAAAPDGGSPLAFTPPIVAADDAPMSAQAVAAGATQDEANAARSKLAQALMQRSLLANAPAGGGQPAPFMPLNAGTRMLPIPPAGAPAGAAPGTPPILTDIPPRPTPEAPIGSVPGPLSRPVPTPSPPPLSGSLAPQQVPASKPAPPILDQRPTPEEVKGLMMLRAHPNDPNFQALAQPWIAYGQQKRQADLAQRQEAYKADLATWQKAQDIALQQGTPKAQLDLQQAQEDAARKQREYEQFGGLTREEALSPIKENLANVRTLPSSAAGINNARAALNGNPAMFTGTMADMQLSTSKLLASLGATPDPRIPPTEAFKNYISGILGTLRPQVAGTGSQSNAELKILQQAAGADITLDRRSMNEILNAVEKLNTTAAIEHQKKVLTFTGANENAQRVAFPLYGVPAMEQVIPGVAVAKLKELYAKDPGAAITQFDSHYYTPGLAQRILQSGR